MSAMDKRARVKDALDRWQQLKAARQPYEADWRDIQEFIQPFRGQFLGAAHLEGENRGSSVVDNSCTKAGRILQAGIQSGLTSPARRWFELGLPDPDLEQYGPVAEWLSTVDQFMYQALRRSNFYTSTHAVYGEEAAFGTGCFYMEEDWFQYIRCQVFTIGQYAIARDGQGRLDTCGRLFPMTPPQIVQAFPQSALSTQMQDDAKSGKQTKHDVLHLVRPRANRDVRSRAADQKRFESVYILCRGGVNEGGQLLAEGGYDEMPYACPAWDRFGSEVMGRGLGHEYIYDVRQLQEMQLAYTVAVQKVVEPPMVAPEGTRIDSMPGGITYRPQNVQAHNATVDALYQMRLDLAALQSKIEDIRAGIREGHFNDLFLHIVNQPNVTATEIIERHEEKLLMLGPVIESQQSEFLDPMLDRTFALLNRAGLLPPAPKEIQGMKLKMEYIGPLAQAQRAVGLQSLERGLTLAGAIAQTTGDPSVLDNVDADDALRRGWDMLGAPKDALRSTENRDAIRRERAETQAQQQQAAEMAAMVEDAQRLSQADTAGKNALTDMVGA